MFERKIRDIIENRRQEAQRTRKRADQRAVVYTVVELRFSLAADASYAFGESDRVPGLDGPIILSCRQKRRRSKRIHEVDRLCAGEADFWSEYFFQRRAMTREKVIGTRKADHGAQVDACIKTKPKKPFAIEGQHGGDMGAGGMAHGDDASWIAPKLRNVINHPAHRLSRIFEEAGEANFRKNR